MRKSILAASLVSFFILPAVLFAADHNMAGMDHNSGTGMQQSMPATTGMNHNMGGTGMGQQMGNMDHMTAGMVKIGEQTVDGVRAEVYLNDVKAMMAQMGGQGTHHLMIHFYGADKQAITAGNVAVKVKGPDGSDVPALKMMGMQGHFGVDLTLDKKGTYNFTIGTQLADNSKRQYEVKYDLK